MDTINGIAKKHGLKVIEDAAQSFGAEYKGERSCSLSDIACTSFFPAKPLGCYGDGGAVFTDDDEIAGRLRVLLNHGQTKRYVHTEIGMNGRLDAIQAAVLKVKLRYFHEEIEKRVEIAGKYNRGLKNITPPYVGNDCKSVWAQYCIRTDNREELLKKCSDNAIPTGIYYPIPLHLQKVFEYLGHREGDFPVSEQASKEIMALPMSAFLSNEEQDYIIDTVNR
jgi:UDP-2-acetamido-2-deoxy-ribo-hexuluronate aminotransferase